MITFKFHGTSHGEGYSGVISGLPDGFTFDVEEVNKELYARKHGLGRSARQVYPDTVVFEGFDKQVTVNGDLRFFVANRSVEERPEITALRSGHSDVVGQARHPEMSVREIAEITSARNSVCYVVLGAICKQFLARRNIFTYHYVEKIGGIASRNRYRFGVSEREPHFEVLHCPCRYATNLMTQAIEQARVEGNSLGGTVAVGATGVPMGLGEILPYTERLDAVIAANLVGIPSVKGITFGIGDKYANMNGVQAHDKLTLQDGQIVYATNNCGGIVAGVSTGADILCHLTVKPVPTVKNVQTVDSVTKQAAVQHYERADVCVVPNVGVIADNILAYVLTNQILKQDK
ncbi:MAG: chorismate synthase [Clostridiales bacterium]|nr:chorismate synthase [Clostridiales bacterium]